MVVVLSLIFGFRPQTVVALKLSDITYESVELKFTEAFQKGYSNKNKAKRRLTYPHSNFPALKTPDALGSISKAKSWGYLGVQR